LNAILQTLLPVFLVIGLGYGLAWQGFLKKEFLSELNRFVYWICLPALILKTLATASSIPEGTALLLLVFFMATVLVTVLAYAMTRVTGLESWRMGSFLQATYRGNLALIGIPILLYAMRGSPEAEVNAKLTQAIFVFAPTMVYYNVSSVIFLVSSQSSHWKESLKKSLRGLVTNPLILACMAGVALYLFPFKLPRPMIDTFDFVGRVAAPAALICVGGGMAGVDMKGRYRHAFLAALLKVGAVPLFAFFLAQFFQLEEGELLILLIFSAAPTAVASYVLAKELKGDEVLASGTILLSTLLSILSLSVVVSLLA